MPEQRIKALLISIGGITEIHRFMLTNDFSLYSIKITYHPGLYFVQPIKVSNNLGEMNLTVILSVILAD